MSIMQVFKVFGKTTRRAECSQDAFDMVEWL